MYLTALSVTELESRLHTLQSMLANDALPMGDFLAVSQAAGDITDELQYTRRGITPTHPAHAAHMALRAAQRGVDTDFDGLDAFIARCDEATR